MIFPAPYLHILHLLIQHLAQENAEHSIFTGEVVLLVVAECLGVLEPDALVCHLGLHKLERCQATQSLVLVLSQSFERKSVFLHAPYLHNSHFLIHNLAEEASDDAVLAREVVLCVVAERLGELEPDVFVCVQPRVGLRLLHLLVVFHVGVALLPAKEDKQFFI